MKSLQAIAWSVILLAGLEASAQTVTGKWYGVGNANIEGTSNNYLIELILEQKGNLVTGEFNYYFKSGYFPNKISGNFDTRSRRLSIKTTPVTYYRSSAVNGVECSMNGDFVLLVSKAGASLKGKFSSTKFYSLTCPDITMNLNPGKNEIAPDAPVEEEKSFSLQEDKKLDAAIPVVPIAFKELSATEKKFPQRRNQDMGLIEVDSSNIRIEVIDNGEIDKDSVSLFFNNHMLANKLELTKRGLVYNITLDPTKKYNEISMFAENLGIIPPNTAVLVVYDGRKRHEVSLTSTLETNGMIRLAQKQPTVQ